MILHTLWADFEAKVIPADAAEYQRQEMRRAFYAGAAGAFGICTGTADKSEDEALVTMKELQTDLEHFRKRIGDGF